MNKYENTISNLDKNIHIIYRDYTKKYNINHILDLKKICRSQRRKLFLANDLRLAVKLNLDGAYIPSFNKSMIPLNLNHKKFCLLGSAHNLKEIMIKKKQNIKFLFISPIFKIKKSKFFLGSTKYNILANNFNNQTIALGGINKNNISMIKKINCSGFASISYIEKYKFNGKKYF